MICKLTRGHKGTYRFDHPDGRSGYFEPGRRTLTGAKHRNGEHRCMSAAMLRAYLGLEPWQCVKPYDTVSVDDKCIFDVLTPVDISMHCKFIYHIVDVPVRTLMGACALEGRKPGNKD